jgi:hypothetical protein
MCKVLKVSYGDQTIASIILLEAACHVLSDGEEHVGDGVMVGL